MCSPTKRKREKGWEKDNARDAAEERDGINVRSSHVDTEGERGRQRGTARERGREAAETRGGVWSTEAVRN